MVLLLGRSPQVHSSTACLPCEFLLTLNSSQRAVIFFVNIFNCSSPSVLSQFWDSILGLSCCFLLFLHLVVAAVVYLVYNYSLLFKFSLCFSSRFTRVFGTSLFRDWLFHLIASLTLNSCIP